MESCCRDCAGRQKSLFVEVEEKTASETPDYFSFIFQSYFCILSQHLACTITKSRLAEAYCVDYFEIQSSGDADLILTLVF